MRRPLLLKPGHTAEEFRALAHVERDPRVRCRLLALGYVAQGHSANEADGLFGLSGVQLRMWIKRYNSHGLEGLVDRPRPGKPTRLSAEQRKAFLAKVQAGPPAELGIGAWRGEDLCRLLKEEFGVEYSLSGVYALLNRLKQSPPAAEA